MLLAESPFLPDNPLVYNNLSPLIKCPQVFAFELFFTLLLVIGITFSFMAVRFHTQTCGCLGSFWGERQKMTESYSSGA